MQSADFFDSKKGLFFAFILALGSFVLFSCRTLPPAPSDLEHEARRPVLQTFPEHWLPISDQEYAEIIAFDQPAIAPAKHPARKMLQAHMDRIDARLRASYPKQLASIPSPRAQLILISEANAQVQSISVCLGRPISCPDCSAYKGQGSDRFWEFNPNANQIVMDPDPQSPVLCARRSFSSDVLSRLFKTLIENQSTCSVQVKDDSLVLRKSCEDRLIGSKEKNQPRADDTAIFLMPDVITYYAGLLTANSEEQVIFWVAHELAHFYRQHGINPASDFQGYYKLGTRNAQTRQQTEAPFRAFGQKVENLRRQIESKGGLSKLSATEKKEWRQLNKDAFEQQIAQYTHEQEADELAVEWIIEDGWEAELGIQTMLDHLKQSGPRRSQTAEKDWDYARCKAAFDNGWKDSEDLPVFVPIGDLNEEHHSVCYRAFNMHREIQSHGYVKVKRGSRPKLLSASEWQTLQSRLRSEFKD